MDIRVIVGKGEVKGESYRLESVVDAEDDPDNPGEQKIAFSSVEGFVPPAAVELATTTTATTHLPKARPGDEVAPEPAPPSD